MTTGNDAPRTLNLMKGLAWTGGILLACCAVIVLSDSYFAGRHSHGQVRLRNAAMNNLRQVSLSLFEFEAEYGQFPDVSTISKVKESTGTPLSLDDSSSNKLFRQLIAYGLKNEKPFWAKTEDTPKEPDNIFDSNRTALAPGECGFAYVAGLSSKDHPDTPVLLAPMLKGQKKFNRSQYQGKAMILFLESAQALPIEKDGRVLINGMDIFDSRQPFWKGKAPEIRWPE